MAYRRTSHLNVLRALATRIELSVYQGRLSADEQRDFDKYYTKWVNDTRKNDRDDIGKDVRHMQEIMAKKTFLRNVPFDQIASSGYSGEGNRDSYLPAALAKPSFFR